MVKKLYNVFFSEISHEKRLIRDLLHDYDIISTLGRPVRNASDSVSISFALGLIRMDVEEKSNMLVLSAWTKYVSYLGVVVLLIFLFIWVLRRFQHCTGHVTTGSWEGRGNQYIQLVKVLYCKLPTNGKQLPAFPLEAMPGTKPRPQRWEARVLPCCITKVPTIFMSSC